MLKGWDVVSSQDDRMMALTKEAIAREADGREMKPADAGISSDSAERKEAPIATGVLDYFPDALFEVARLSKVGNEKHNPGQPLHWSRGKSADHADCIIRHMLQRGTFDADGILHDAKVAWRALAQLQLALEKQRAGKAN